MGVRVRVSVRVRVRVRVRDSVWVRLGLRPHLGHLTSAIVEVGDLVIAGLVIAGVIGMHGNG